MAYTTWNTAVAGAKAGTHRAKILYIGDSIVTGENASSRATRLPELLVSTLRSNFGLSTGGQGLSPAIGFSTYLSSDASWKNPFTKSGTTGTATVATTQGDQGIYLNSGAYITRTVTGDSDDLIYLGVSTGLGGITWGSITVSVDGTTVATLDVTTPGALAPGQIYHFSLGTAGSHTVKYTATGGAVVIDGDVIYNGDYTAGICSWDASHVGYESEDTITQMGASGVTTGSTAGNWAGWQNFGPDLVILDQIGLNDLLNGDSAPSVCASDLSTMLTALKALSSNPSILVFAPMRVSGIEAGVNGSYHVADYVSASKTVAQAAGSSVNWLDLNDVYPYASIPSSWTTGDSANLHPNDTGQAAEVSAIAPLLEPASTYTGTATFSGAGTLTASGLPHTAGAAGFGGTGTLSAAGTVHTAASASLSGSGTLTTASTPNLATTAGFSGTGTLSTASSGYSAVALFTGAGALTAGGKPTVIGVVPFAGVGTLVGIGTLNTFAAALFTGTGVLGVRVPGTNQMWARTENGWASGTLWVHTATGWQSSGLSARTSAGWAAIS